MKSYFVVAAAGLLAAGALANSVWSGKASGQNRSERAVGFVREGTKSVVLLQDDDGRLRICKWTQFGTGDGCDRLISQ